MPNEITEQNLGQELQAFGPILNINIIQKATNNGQTAFGCISLESYEKASQAIDYLNNAYILLYLTMVDIIGMLL